MNLRPPSVTVSTHTSAFKAVAFQSPAMPNARMSLWTQSVHSFSFLIFVGTTNSECAGMYTYRHRPYICKQIMQTAVIYIYVQLATSRFGNLTWLIHTLPYVRGCCSTYYAYIPIISSATTVYMHICVTTAVPVRIVCYDCSNT